MNEKIKLELISFVQTFVALFLTDMAIALTQIPADQILSGKILLGAVLVGAISAAARSALKGAWQATMPVKLGGKEE